MGDGKMEWNQYIALWSGQGRPKQWQVYSNIVKWKHKVGWLCNVSGPNMVMHETDVIRGAARFEEGEKCW